MSEQFTYFCLQKYRRGGRAGAKEKLKTEEIKYVRKVNK